MNIPTDWTFKNVLVAENFDAHVREQLPWYDLATGMVAHIARHYIPHKGVIYDIGASTGNIGRALSGTITARDATLLAIEDSKEMAALYSGPGLLEIADATECEFVQFDVAILFLSLMFVPVNKRKSLLQKLIQSGNQGGAIIIFDKVSPPPGYIGTVIRRLTIAGKIASGVDPSAVIAKELSLSGVQRPILEADLHEIAISCTKVFQFGEFSGFVLEL